MDTPFSVSTQSVKRKITVGLALSGAGNRSSFYIGLLEVFDKHGLELDYISAMSGGALVAAAYSCGTLEEFKQEVLKLNKQTIKKFIAKNPDRGGLYSLEPLEQEMLRFTQGKTFEEAKPKMAFVCIDIETGKQVTLCIGDIARAARISCTVPGAFEPVLWAGRPLVDGGLLNSIPVDVLKEAGIDFSIGINMRGTKHIFSERVIGLKKALNFIKKVLFIDELENLFKDEEGSGDAFDFSKKPGLFSILGKSLDLVIKANQEKLPETLPDLLITPDVPLLKRSNFTESQVLYYYEIGKQIGEEYVPKIQQMIKEKQIKANAESELTQVRVTPS